ncbi:MAG: hypothetical protein HY260_01435 [Chloroflexi bacterium]|nr:hypothetical protein [Chloroflexota bacterium]
METLTATLPLLDDAPADMAGELAAMAHLSDEALQELAHGMIPPERQELLHDLLDEQGRGELDETGQRELAALMAEYGRHMLRRAKAVGLLIARGRPVPVLSRPSPDP